MASHQHKEEKQIFKYYYFLLKNNIHNSNSSTNNYTIVWDINYTWEVEDPYPPFFK